MPNKFLIRFALIAVFTALAAAISFPLVSTYLADTGHDGHWYVLLAEGRGDEVMKPFSGRFLYPFLAGMADAYIPGNIGYSFFALGMISLFLFLWQLKEESCRYLSGPRLSHLQPYATCLLQRSIR